jgi:hypothetical protein
MKSSSENLYELVQEKAAIVRRSGLREALGRIDAKLRNRSQAGDAIADIYSLGCEHKRSPKNGVDFNYAEFIVAESLDAAYQLDMGLPCFARA